MKERETFGRFGAIMAMAGSAVGLGNLWRFPYFLIRYVAPAAITVIFAAGLLFV